MNSEKDKLSRSDAPQIPPAPVQEKTNVAKSTAPPVPKRRRHYYTDIPQEQTAAAAEASAEEKPEESKTAEQKTAEQKPEKPAPAKEKTKEPKNAYMGPVEKNAAEQMAVVPPVPSDDYDYPDGYKPDPPNRKAMIIAVSVASVIAAAVIGFLIYLIVTSLGTEEAGASSTADSAVETTVAASTQDITENSSSQTFTMPDMSGMSESEAYDVLNKLGMKYKVIRVFSETVPYNRVVSHLPVWGTPASLDQEATIYLSKGREDEIIESTTKPRAAKATEPKTTAPKATESKGTVPSFDGDYILPDSASRRLKQSDIKDLDRDLLNLALNEIFARHGRKFTDPDISAYFNSKSWYHGTIASGDFDMSILNQYETYNVNLISNYQTEKGYR